MSSWFELNSKQQSWKKVLRFQLSENFSCEYDSLSFQSNVICWLLTPLQSNLVHVTKYMYIERGSKNVWKQLARIANFALEMNYHVKLEMGWKKWATNRFGIFQLMWFSIYMCDIAFLSFLFILLFSSAQNWKDWIRLLLCVNGRKYIKCALFKFNVKFETLYYSIYEANGERKKKESRI